MWAACHAAHMLTILKKVTDMYKKEIVGFDVREMWLDVTSQWTPDKKGRILLRLDVSKPLSVDRHVWFSVFSELSQPNLWYGLDKYLKYYDKDWDSTFSNIKMLSVPNNYRPRGVWRNLDELQHYVQMAWKNAWKPSCMVAIIEVISDDTGEDEKYEGPEPISPNTIDNMWILLGYDVADYELITGLFNGEMDANEAIIMQHEWGNYLNGNHLFIEPQKAFEYITVANSKYPSHKPYYVYALYEIQKNNV